MPLTRPAYAVDNVQQLADIVQDQSTIVKQTFDKTGADTKTFLTDTLIPEVETLDAQNIKLTGNQTVAGVKTFSSSPAIPTPTADMQASTKKYVDDKDTAQTTALTNHKASADHDDRYYTITEVNAIGDNLAGVGRTTETIKANADAIANLAGAGRTAETVKGVADSVGALNTTVSEHLAENATLQVNVKSSSFGAKGDGITDDTIALQLFFDYITTNRLNGIIPPGTYLISQSINIASADSWKVEGVNANSVIIMQQADDTPIFRFLNGADMHSVQIRGLAFDYVNQQPSINVNANPIQFETMPYECIFDDLSFNGGAYGIYVKDGAQNPWGCTFDNLRFGENLSIGAIRMSNLNAVPNNKFGRLFCSCKNMVGPVFNLKGYNCVIECIEFIAANLGAELMFFQSGAEIEIGAIKLENGVYDSTRKSNFLFDISNGSSIHIGSVHIAGDSLSIPAGNPALYIFRASGGSSKLTIDYLYAGGTLAVNNAYAFNFSNFIMLNHSTLENGWALSNLGSTDSAEYITINSYLNNKLGGDRGDADYTIALGDKNIFTYETVLTAPRICNLPSDKNNLFNGLRYKAIIFTGVVTATNTLTFKAGTRTIKTLTVGNVAIEFMFRRGAGTNGQDGWVIVDYSTLP